jgi:hypothetical protein
MRYKIECNVERCAYDSLYEIKILSTSRDKYNEIVLLYYIS